jgi:hypothetical protein
VQPHFEVLLKRRLRQEIAHRPPLFPWEKALQEYPDSLQPAGVPSLWLDHLKNLSVPSTMPEEMLAELLNQCQRVAREVQQTGKRLVAAVETLFPDQPQSLEHIAGLVARPAYRSAHTDTLAQIDYAAASPQQQIAVAMLVAQGIFEALAMTVSAAQPSQEKSWLTSAGLLTVQATYGAVTTPYLEVLALVPDAGSLRLSSPTETLSSERSTPGELVLRLAAPADAVHRLEVSLGSDQVAPLSFQISVEG